MLYIYASSKAKALRKIRQAIDMWLDMADRQFRDDVLAVRDTLSIMSD